jgi:hypothetical protein
MNPEPLKGIRGTFSKDQLFGESHWTSYLTTSSIAIEGIREVAREGFSDAFGLLGKCKALAREVKSQEAPDKEKLRRGETLLPSRALADKLVEAYLQTLETVFRILDVEQFNLMYARYWENLGERSTRVSIEFVADLRQWRRCQLRPWCQSTDSHALDLSGLGTTQQSTSKDKTRPLEFAITLPLNACPSSQRSRQQDIRTIGCLACGHCHAYGATRGSKPFR